MVRWWIKIIMVFSQRMGFNSVLLFMTHINDTFQYFIFNLLKRFDCDLYAKEKALESKLELMLVYLQNVKRKRIDKKLEYDKQYLGKFNF